MSMKASATAHTVRDVHGRDVASVSACIFCVDPFRASSNGYKSWSEDASIECDMVMLNARYTEGSEENR